jgi:hypothetical protein
MNSLEHRPPLLVLEYDFDLHWGIVNGDVAFHPNFFEDAIRAFRKLSKGLDEQEQARAKRQDPIGVAPRSPKLLKSLTSTSKDGDGTGTAALAGLEPNCTLDHGRLLTYRRRHPEIAQEISIPNLAFLGEATSDAAKLVPRIRAKLGELPPLSHRFFVLPLEEAMDM